MFRVMICLTSALLVLATGCGPSPGSRDRDQPKADPTALAEGRKFRLDSEPAVSKSVIEVRKSAEDGAEVVVAGQVGGREDPFTGQASFLIADLSLKPTVGCECPWDFCEYKPKEVAAACLFVKFVDEEGNTLRWGAKEAFQLEGLSRVVVKGKVKRDKEGNVTVLASSIYVRPAQE